MCPTILSVDSVYVVGRGTPVSLQKTDAVTTIKSIQPNEQRALNKQKAVLNQKDIRKPPRTDNKEQWYLYHPKWAAKNNQKDLWNAQSTAAVTLSCGQRIAKTGLGRWLSNKTCSFDTDFEFKKYFCQVAQSRQTSILWLIRTNRISLHAGLQATQRRRNTQRWKAAMLQGCW